MGFWELHNDVNTCYHMYTVSKNPSVSEFPSELNQVKISYGFKNNSLYGSSMSIKASEEASRGKERCT